MQQLPLTAHIIDVNWPLIKAVMANPTYKKMYMAHAKTITTEMFTSHLYETDAIHYQTLIDTAVLNDANKFFSYTQFQTGLTANTTIGSYTVPGVKTLMDVRTNYLNATADFNYAQPIISNTGTVGTVGAIGGFTTINTTVSNATSVFVKIRANYFGKFVATQLYDDGAHNDGAAADGVYGNDVLIASANNEYYIYAENADAAKFAPERAEHEFYRFAAATLATANFTDAKNKLQVFPNPATARVTVIAPPNTLGKPCRLCNQLGQTVRETTVSANTNFDLAELPNGFYFLTIEGFNAKVVVTK
jgi:hypothetical protein